ncbi:MAG TPA: hypothetical protein DDX91_09000 [Ruminococcaceae bacterium]|nr:hypothetical protein [Oscillospiraceae bacterium]
MIVIKNEIIKLFSQKSLLLLIMILLTVNAVTMLFSGNGFGEENYGIPDSAYKLMQRELSEIPENERMQYIEEQIYAREVYSALRYADEYNIDMPIEEIFPILSEEKAQQYIERYSDGQITLSYTGDTVGEELFLTKIKNEMEIVYGYKDYLDAIQKQAEQMKVSSILGNNRDPFSRKNIEKTAQIYSSIQKKELTYNITENIRLGINGSITDVCALLTVAFAALSLICEERESNAFSLLRTLKKGRIGLMLCKIFTLLILCLISSVIFSGSSILICGLRFGFCDLSIPIQSVSGFIGCTISVNIGQYLILFALIKTLSYFTISAVVLFVSIIAKNNIMIYGISVGIIGIEILIYYTVSRLSAFGFVKYINLFAFTKTNYFLGEYHNINFAGNPVNLTAVSVISMSVLGIGLSVLSVFFYSKSKNMVYSTYKLSALLRKINPFGSRISSSQTVHECHKILFSEKGLIVMLLMAVASYYVYTSFYIIQDESDGYFRQLVKEHGGTVTEETDEYVKNREDYFEQVLNETDTDSLLMSLVLRQKNGFDIFAERYYYAKENDLEIIYDTGYTELFKIKNTLGQLLLLFAFMSIILAPVFAFDSKTSTLIRSSKLGRKKNILIRGAICGVIVIFMFFDAHLPVFLRILKTYGMDGINSDVHCLSILRSFPFGISILSYLILRYIWLLVIALCVMAGMLFISKKTKSANACMILLLAVFAIPLAAWWGSI